MSIIIEKTNNNSGCLMKPGLVSFSLSYCLSYCMLFRVHFTDFSIDWRLTLFWKTFLVTMHITVLIMSKTGLVRTKKFWCWHDAKTTRTPDLNLLYFTVKIIFKVFIKFWNVRDPLFTFSSKCLQIVKFYTFVCLVGKCFFFNCMSF